MIPGPAHIGEARPPQRWFEPGLTGNDNWRMSAANQSDAGAGPLLLSDLRDGVATLTLNQPERFNPLSEAMLDALIAAIDRHSTDPDVRVLVLAARGRAFSAGHDLREMRAHPDAQYYRTLFTRCTRLMLGIVRCPKPVIARVQGLATAAGCQLVATCDLAVSADTARFAVSGVTLGLFCSTPGVALSRNVPRKRAFEMLITGEFIDAPTARDYGLVNRVVPSARLDDAVGDLAASIVRHPPVAVETGKRMFYRQIEQSLEEAYQYAGDVMACNMMESDTLEGVQAFLDKRPPDWPHRR